VSSNSAPVKSSFAGAADAGDGANAPAPMAAIATMKTIERRRLAEY
jgi:hypothetical protein